MADKKYLDGDGVAQVWQATKDYADQPSRITTAMLAQNTKTEAGILTPSGTVTAGSYINSNAAAASNANFSSFTAQFKAGTTIHADNLTSTWSIAVIAKKTGETTYEILTLGAGTSANPSLLDFAHDVVEDGTYVVSWRNNTTPHIYATRTETPRRVYVSTSGADSNDGSYAHPLATIGKALLLGAREIGMFGGKYYECVNFQYFGLFTGKLKMFSVEQTGRVQFYPPDTYISKATSATVVNGYTKVKTATMSREFASSNNWIYQDGVADTSTEILDSERHPLQRGQYYRCEDTLIKRCAATTQADALTEIENATDYRFFQNGTTVYFSCPETVSADHPIMASMGNRPFVLPSNNRLLTLELVGIEVKYGFFDFRNTICSKAVDCKVSNNFGSGGFMYDSAINMQFLRCEASRTQTRGGGDGFNAHSVYGGETFSKQTTCTIVDCWAHDNNDDGYSDHERCETTIIGGLYEYNGKAGVTPSYGSHCTCYNVHSRRNYSGFVYTGATAEEEGGNDGQMELFSCLSDNNTRGTGNYGYCVRGGGNVARLVNCKSIGNAIGFYADGDNAMQLIDCGSLGDTNAKGGNGTITALVTTAVS